MTAVPESTTSTTPRKTMIRAQIGSRPGSFVFGGSPPSGGSSDEDSDGDSNEDSSDDSNATSSSGTGSDSVSSTPGSTSTDVASSRARRREWVSVYVAPLLPRKPGG